MQVNQLLLLDWEDEATVDVGQPISGANAEPIKSSRPGKSTSFSRTLDNITQRLARLRHPASFGVGRQFSTVSLS